MLKCTLPLPFIPNLSVICVGEFMICLVWCIVVDKRIKVSLPLLIFIVIALIGLLIKQPPLYYRSTERLLIFVLNIAFLSPLLISPTLQVVRTTMFSILLINIRIIVVASFFAYLAGINLASRAVAHDVYWGFAGITSQSMLLAPCCVICLLECIWKILYENGNRAFKYINWIVLFMALWTMLAAGSRGSILGFVCALFPLFYYYKLKRGLFIRLFFIFVIGLIIIPERYYEMATYTIAKKQMSAKVRGSITSSRDEKWEARWNEFTDAPLLGVGFASQTHFSSDDSLDWIQKTGSLEPGSSWLAILAMTGFSGFVVLFIFNFQLLLFLLRIVNTNRKAIFMLSIFIFFVVHGMIEGWILYSGGFVFFMYWLFMGNINEIGILENKNDKL